MSESTVLSPEEFKKRLDEGKVDFIFDLRNEDEYKAWHVEGRREIESLNIPQTDFVGEEDRHMDRFPKDREIAVICAHGDSSKYTADLLSERGFNAYTLAGGMDSWSDYYETHKVSDDPEIHQMYRVARGCITHIVVSGGKAVVLDPHRHVQKIIDSAERIGARITHILDTHLHADHISGGSELAAKTGAEYHLHPIDAPGAKFKYTGLKGGSKITVGDCTFDVIHSPGHTPGSTSFLMNGKYLFTGDTIMKSDMGRPDLGGMSDKWALMLYYTLFKRFRDLPDDTVVLPAHSTSIREQNEQGIVTTTLGAARHGMKLFDIRDTAKFVDYVRHSLPENPERYKEIRKVNLGLLDPDEKKRKELEIGKNLCGMSRKD